LISFQSVDNSDKLNNIIYDNRDSTFFDQLLVFPLRPNQNLPADLSGVAHLSAVAPAIHSTQCGGGLAKAEVESEDLSKAGLPAILLAG
jgi:hypothetical protein